MSVCQSVRVTSSHLASSPSFLSFPHPLPTTLSPSYSIALAIFIFLLSFCLSTNVSMPLFSSHLKVLTPCLILTPHTSYILTTLCFSLRLSNLLIRRLVQHWGSPWNTTGFPSVEVTAVGLWHVAGFKGTRMCGNLGCPIPPSALAALVSIIHPATASCRWACGRNLGRSKLA